MRTAIATAAWLALCLMAGAAAQAKPAAGAEDYAAGLDALSQSQWVDAAASFDKAVAADEDNPDYYTARGVANVLGERFDPAIKDLGRALRLRADDRETKVWLAAAYSMSNNPMKGSELFTHGKDMPADYASLVYNDMAAVYWSSRYQGSYFDKTQGRQVPVKEPVRTEFPHAAERFIKRHRTGEAAGAVTLTRMKDHYQKHDYTAALREVDLLRAAAPDDATLLTYHAGCILALGDLLGAREEYTRLLCRDSDWAQGYLDRALAAAKIGDPRRARADLKSAEKLDPTAAKAVRPALDEALAQIKDADPAAALAELEKAAAGGDAKPSDLVNLALAVQRAMNGRRLYLDETYQDQVHALRDAVKAKPDDATRLETLARFLYLETSVMSVWDGPRTPARKLRVQSPAEAAREMIEAEQTVDKALKADPKHADALATKGWILYGRGEEAAALDLAQRGLAVAPNNYRLLKLSFQVHLNNANRLRSEARALRTPTVWTTYEDRADGRYAITHTRMPSAADLALADEKDKQADAELALATDAHKKALAATKGTPQGYILQGESEASSGRLEAAAESYEQAVKLDPASVPAHRALVTIYTQLKDGARALDHQLTAANLQSTTCAPLLAVGWDQVVRTAMRSAREGLDRAAGIDAADPRWAAWRAVAEDADGKADRAVVFARVGLALVEARARLRGQTLDATSGGGAVTLEDLGPGMSLRLLLARLYAAGGKSDQAATLYQGLAGLEARIPRDLLIQPFPPGMLPDPQSDPTLPQEAPSILGLLASSHIAMGQALVAQKKYDEADKEFLVVKGYEANWPSTAPGRETIYPMAAQAMLGRARVALAKGDVDGAFHLLTYQGFPGRLGEEITRERKDLEAQIKKARDDRSAADQARDAAMTPQDRQRQYFRDTIASFQQQKAAAQAALARPDVSDREKRALQGTIEQLDMMIAQFQKSLEDLDRPPGPRR